MSENSRKTSQVLWIAVGVLGGVAGTLAFVFSYFLLLAGTPVAVQPGVQADQASLSGNSQQVEHRDGNESSLIEIPKESDQETGPANPLNSAAIESPESSTSPAPTSTNSLTVQDPQPVAIAASPRPSANTELVYHWKPDVTLSYAFKIEYGTDLLRETTGICSYDFVSEVALPTAVQEGSGTGFVVADGILATCEHVVRDAKSIEVSIGDQTYQATVVAADSRADVALLRIDASGLQPLPLIDSESTELAETVRAIGYPLSDVLGRGVKISTGSVAGFVSLPGDNNSRQIQVDAPINQGNSGGPVVNDAGQVIGIASAKLSGASITSVGFVVPANELRRVAAEHGIELPIAERGSGLAGPAIARQVTPSVAYIKAGGISPGRIVQVNFLATYSEFTSARNRGGFLSPATGTSNSFHDQGSLALTSRGEVLEFNGTEQLPALLGPVGTFFIEPVDGSRQGHWTVQRQSVVRQVRENQDPLADRLGALRMLALAPLLGEPEEQVIAEFPAVEQITYRLRETQDHLVTIDKEYEFTALQPDGQAYLSIHGTGTLKFDTQLGMPSELEFSVVSKQRDGEAMIETPAKVTYTLRNPDEVKREREIARQKLQAAQQQRELDQNEPSPERVEQVLDAIIKTDGSYKAYELLERLSTLAIVDDKRRQVLEITRGLMQNSNSTVGMAATLAFCHWASVDEKAELLKILDSNDPLMYRVKSECIATLAPMLTVEDAPLLIKALSAYADRSAIQEALVAMGSEIEATILEQFASVSENSARRELLKVLKRIGTQASIEFLKELATSGDHAIRYEAQETLDAIRSRQ